VLECILASSELSTCETASQADFLQRPIMINLDLYEAGAEQLSKGLSSGTWTSRDLVAAYLKRIEEVNDRLHAVVTLHPRALALADEKDKERVAALANGCSLPPLHGLPILIKDNIATGLEDGMECTAGSYALKGAIYKDDAPIVQRLKAAGAIILGKTAMHQWAGMRDWDADVQAYSTVGGQVK
jgi:amidase